MLRFRLFGIPVGVHWTFALIGIIAIRANPIELVVAFVVGVFIAVLAHEMGHALTARAFGAKQVKITLMGLGGLTQYPADTPLTPGRRFLIAASGSAVGMTLGGAVYLSRNTSFARDLFDYGYMIGVGIAIAGLLWGALNWLPILPLDGGNMVWHALEIVTPRFALQIAKALTLATAGAVVYLAINVWNNTFGAVFVAIIALQGLQIRAPNAAPRQPRPTPADEASLLSIFDDDKPES